jgi:hypothetical protein
MEWFGELTLASEILSPNLLLVVYAICLLWIQELNQLDMHDGYGLMRRRLLNDRLLLAERSFLQAEGLQGRAWYKHLVSNPWHYYSITV